MLLSYIYVHVQQVRVSLPCAGGPEFRHLGSCEGGSRSWHWDTALWFVFNAVFIGMLCYGLYLTLYLMSCPDLYIHPMLPCTHLSCACVCKKCIPCYYCFLTCASATLYVLTSSFHTCSLWIPSVPWSNVVPRTGRSLSSLWSRDAVIILVSVIIA